MLPPTLVIFDCDGVMFDSREANRHYYNCLRRHFGHPDMDEDEVAFVHVHHVMASVQHIFRNYPGDLEAAEVFRRTVDYTPFLRYMEMEPDLVDFLKFLSPCCDTAISTNRTTTMPIILEQFGLAPYFGKVVTAIDVAHPKPHPEALHVILQHFGKGVDEAIFIGDSDIDRAHTAAIGMRLIAFRNPSLPAEFHVDRFSDIPALPCFRPDRGQPFDKRAGKFV